MGLFQKCKLGLTFDNKCNCINYPMLQKQITPIFSDFKQRTFIISRIIPGSQDLGVA